MIHNKKTLIAILTSFVVFFVASCTDLAAVRKWSETSLEATQYNEIVTTYTNTPQRLKRYDPSGNWDSQIEVRKKQAEALKLILSVVTDYMASLAILSADSTIDYNKDVDSLTKSIGNLNINISNETIGAMGSIVKAVLGAAAKGYQAKQVSNLIEQANEPLQTILQSELRSIIDKDFRRDLAIEKLWLGRYYDSQVQTGNPSDAAKTALMEWKEFRLSKNASRVNAVNAYISVLDKISKGHQELYDNRNDLNSKLLVKNLFSLVKEIRKQIKILEKS